MVFTASQGRLEVSGKVVFLRSETVSASGGYCVCCGDPDVAHPHVYGEIVDFPSMPSLFVGLTDHSIQDYLQRFIHSNMETIEGKTIKVFFEIVEPPVEANTGRGGAQKFHNAAELVGIYDTTGEIDPVEYVRSLRE